MSGNKHTLDAYLGKMKIATLDLKEDQHYWQYTQTWQQTGYSVSPHLPLQGEILPINVGRFLRNMLPEGIFLDELLNNFHLSKTNTFGLIRALGLDIPGAIVMIDSDKT